MSLSVYILTHTHIESNSSMYFYIEIVHIRAILAYKPLNWLEALDLDLSSLYSS